ncbi:Endo-1,4-beta-xylanase A precursor [Planctomycetes bacterium Pan216]|uniref:Endo-1,4-beta-xylanase A n=1 Tax=Kolteria novifilia TaxID=2527975 RepID=A0A518B817_9BACT|nr:Endo-1,4-beta-xylanase A precursor [Planctomycetes bacterium Pan216]
MKGLHFTLPPNAGIEPERFQHGYVTGLDRSPMSLHVEMVNGIASVYRATSESGSLHLPWEIDRFGEIVVQSTSLMEREEPYRLSLELARGQLNKMRNQHVDWAGHGLKVSDAVQDSMQRSSQSFRNAFQAKSEEEREAAATDALSGAIWAAEGMTEGYARRATRTRVRDRGPIKATLACMFDDGLFDVDPGPFRSAFNHVQIPLRWAECEPEHGQFDWSTLDRQIGWCEEHGLEITLGPLIDFHESRLPGWLSNYEQNVELMATLMLDLVETCMARYKGRIACWETTARTNIAGTLRLNEDQMLWITRRLSEVGKSIDPDAALTATICQPWGEYFVRQDQRFSPGYFADSLYRLKLPLSTLTFEIAMGYAPDGSFCRSLLDVSQLMDSLHEVCGRLRVRLVFPSQAIKDGPVTTSAGRWRGEFSEAIQAEWAEKVTLVGLAKPFVDGITWGMYHDAHAMDWPHGGLIDREGQPKPALERLTTIRGSLLR